MIISFGDKVTADVFNGISNSRVRRLPHQIVEYAVMKLDILNSAHNIDDLRSPPGNRLEQLSGNLRGFYSIRINNQWRIIFRWDANNAYDVRIVDYH